MTYIQHPDSGGDNMNLLKLNNQLFPPFPADVIQNIPTLEMRSDDVIICAYPKAGTHWVWEIARYLQAGRTNVPVVEKDDAMLECVRADYLATLPSPRILNTHLPFDQLPVQVAQKGCKIVYIDRNPKDLAVSNYHHHRKLYSFYRYSGTWENFLPLFMDGKLDYGSWFDYVKDWERVIKENIHPPLHVTSYEDFKKAPLEEVYRLATFLGRPVSRGFATFVVDKCSFHNMRSLKGSFDFCERGEPIMYRKGQVGDWKNWFTVTQNELMDECIRTHMDSSSLSFKYSLDCEDTHQQPESQYIIQYKEPK